MAKTRTGYAAANEKNWKVRDVNELQEMVDSYFENQDISGRPYTVAGLALQIGTNVNVLRDIYFGNESKVISAMDLPVKTKKLIAEIIGKAMLRIFEYAEASCYNKDNFRGSEKILSSIFGLTAPKSAPEKLEVILPESLKKLAE